MEIIDRYRNARNKLVLLDYDGTLVDFTIRPDDAKPPGRLLKILSKISDDPSVKIVIITGREYRGIEKFIGHLPIDIIAEHGAMIKEHGTWKEQANDAGFWKKGILLTLKEITSKCPGSFIEEKSFSLAWHYRDSDPESGYACSREIMGLLDGNIHSYVLKVLDGNKVVEIFNKDIGKGRAVKNLVEQNDYDCILSIGDDRTDEEMFDALKENEKAITIKVGDQVTCAKYRLNAPENVLQLLELL